MLFRSQIVISSRSSSANLLFSQNIVQPNIAGATMTQAALAQNNNQDKYLVDINTGDLKIPTLGAIHAEGLTKSSLEKEIIKRTLEYISDEPVVNIRFVNFRVTFLGSVALPGTKVFESERVSFLQGLGEVGGVAPGGEIGRAHV